MKILVTLEYSSRGIRIARGEYDTTDARLHGLSEMLVSAGHAVVTDTTPTVIEPPKPIESTAKVETPKRTRKG